MKRVKIKKTVEVSITLYKKDTDVDILTERQEWVKIAPHLQFMAPFIEDDFFATSKVASENQYQKS